MSSETRSYELKGRAERQLQTRRRIVDATVALHEELGPARTTIAEIARRAGVQRLTVYNHFPEESDLFAACQGQFLAPQPPPDFGPALALAPFGAQGAKARRLQVVLALALDFWTWHRLEREGLDDVAAAELMAGLVAAVA